MSKQTYMNGFCKVAAANNVNPQALARYALEKNAGDGASVMDKILAYARDIATNAKSKWDGAGEGTKAIIKLLGGASAGSAIGTGIAAAVNGKKDLRRGAVTGALLGTLAGGSQVNWHNIYDKLDDLSKAAKGRVEESKAVQKD
jgi:hypothetical protein